MRTFLLICAVLILASCVHKPMGKLQSATDSSPIIISDSSIHAKFDKPGRDFKKTSTTTATIQQTNHKPEAIGYQCDPSRQPTGTPCATLCDPNKIAPGCKVSTDPSSIQKWTLYLCESGSPCVSPGTVQATWDSTSGDFETITATAEDGKSFKHIKATIAAGGEVAHSTATALQSASLTTTTAGGQATTYSFTCPAMQECLRIGYDCAVSSSAKCQ